MNSETEIEIGNALPISKSVQESMAKANYHHDKVIKYGNKMLEFARKAGWNLRQIKSELGHGAFMDYVKKEFNASHRTATNYMRINLEWHKLNKRLGDIDSISKALAYLRQTPKEGSTRARLSRAVLCAIDEWTEREIEAVCGGRQTQIIQQFFDGLRRTILKTLGWRWGGEGKVSAFGWLRGRRLEEWSDAFTEQPLECSKEELLKRSIASEKESDKPDPMRIEKLETELGILQREKALIKKVYLRKKKSLAARREISLFDGSEPNFDEYETEPAYRRPVRGQLAKVLIGTRLLEQNKQ